MNSEILAAANYQRRLVIYVVWHPEFVRGREMAERIYKYFAREPEQPNARGLGIPVFFRSEPVAGKLPAPVVMDEAQHTAVVVLADAKMVIAGNDWSGYVAPLARDALANPARHRVFPVAFTPNAYKLFPEANFIRLQEVAPDAAPGLLLNRLTNELGRLLTQRPTVGSVEREGAGGSSPPKMRLFLSHAKLDGENVAKVLRDYIQENLALDTFFDTIDIAAGFRFSDEIDQGIDTAAFALIHTDAYASRVWCQHEVIRAKRRGRPLVVIHAIEEGEGRSFPYLGNVPTIRWRPNDPARLQAIVGLVLREVLRTEYFNQHFEDLCLLFKVPAGVRALARAPELLTALALRTEADQVPFFVYPDPPLAKQELDLVLDLAPNLRLTTPTLLFANPVGSDNPQLLAKSLTRRRVGLSISESENLAQRGLGFPRLPDEKAAPSSPHLRDSMTEFARFLLAAGATLAYGGDLRQGGFTVVLFELLAAYRVLSGEDSPPLQSWLCWPIHLDLTEDQEANWAGLVEFHKIKAPEIPGLDPAVKLPPTTPENLLAWARSLTSMREQMNAETDARIFLGGQIGSFGVRGLGRYPGLAEEALLALRAHKPVYLIGAFGGCTDAIIAALRGQKPAAFTDAERLADEKVRAACEFYNQHLPPGGEPVNYAALTAELEQIGVSGLNNGLTAEENERLFTTMVLPEMIALVLRGLGRLEKSPKG
ncbi:MAG TPA: TIR domain-containing protein [Verrucomicrobiota bacterium]|nr:hypothetical protein [Verrucomicrobiales bacterium]HRI13419.1 TIR domain-containing protein [Verrucomicrobiota bacterium]